MLRQHRERLDGQDRDWQEKLDKVRQLHRQAIGDIQEENQQMMDRMRRLKDEEVVAAGSAFRESRV